MRKKNMKKCKKKIQIDWLYNNNNSGIALTNIQAYLKYIGSTKRFMAIKEKS